MTWKALFMSPYLVEEWVAEGSVGGCDGQGGVMCYTERRWGRDMAVPAVALAGGEPAGAYIRPLFSST
jgi:hypothetical protein